MNERVLTMLSRLICRSWPIKILNVVSWLVGGVWLLFKGEWQLVLYGFIFSVVFAYCIPFLMLPNHVLGTVNWAKFKGLKRVVAWGSQVYIGLLLVVTCRTAFAVCAKHAGAIDSGFIPFLLWSWVLALGPWQYAVSKERDPIVHVPVSSAMVFYLLFMITLFISTIANLVVAFLFVIVQVFVLPWLMVSAVLPQEVEVG